MQPQESCLDAPCDSARAGDGLFYEPDVSFLIASNTADGGIMTGNGSLFYIDPADGELDAAVDFGPVITPEPASWILVVTSVIGLAVLVRIRMVRMRSGRA
jgi:hypothetical protein